MRCGKLYSLAYKDALWGPLIPAREPVMNSRRRPNNGLFDGRIEKRLHTSIPVYLASPRDPVGERTLTENVSPHGARIISKSFWRPGEEPLITPLTGDKKSAEFPQVGTVIYCMSAGDRFCVGVEFPTRTVKWGEHSSA